MWAYSNVECSVECILSFRSVILQCVFRSLSFRSIVLRCVFRRLSFRSLILRFVFRSLSFRSVILWCAFEGRFSETMCFAIAAFDCFTTAPCISIEILILPCVYEGHFSKPSSLFSMGEPRASEYNPCRHTPISYHIEVRTLSCLKHV